MKTKASRPSFFFFVSMVVPWCASCPLLSKREDLLAANLETSFSTYFIYFATNHTYVEINDGLWKN
jgi:ribosome-associated toxin RatA of RatAB toxin-antitoxin module